MLEIAAAVSMANAAFSALKKGMETGRELEDMMGYYTKWFEAKESLSEQSINSVNQPRVKRLFSGSSVEAQALEVTAAKHRIAQMERELRDYLLYSGQAQFYEDMMRERRRIREARLTHARRRAETRKFWFDFLVGGVIVLVGVSVLVGTIVFLTL